MTRFYLGMLGDAFRNFPPQGLLDMYDIIAVCICLISH